MLDIKYIRENPEEVQASIEARGVSGIAVAELLDVDAKRRTLQQHYDEARAAQKKAKSREEGESLKANVQKVEAELREVTATYNALMVRIPNALPADTPEGLTDDANVEIEVHGTAPSFDFEPKDHVELGARLGLDLEKPTAIAGRGFPILRGDLALLERGLMEFVLQEARKRGYEYTQVPVVSRPDILRGIGFSPRRDDASTEIFNLADDDLCLTGTAEIALVGQFSATALDSAQLPLKVVGHTPCFRREGGAAGRRDRGLYRQKMFNKVELVAISTPEQAPSILEEIKQFEVDMCTALELHFRVVRICAGDLGAPAYKKYDVEAAMVGRGADGGWGFGELTSTSNCTDFQARRLGITYKNPAEKGRGAFAYTLNGTGVTTRALIAILEQHQNADGTINIPKVLQPYMGKAVV